MKKLFVFLFLFASLTYVMAQNNACETSDPFCTGTTYDFPAGVDAGSGQSGPNYGCLGSTPNPAWYYMQVATSGPIVIYMHSTPQVDIDFACWGPFTSAYGPCTAQLTAACTSCPNNTSNPTFYPSGNLVDCSYSTSWNETVHINSAISDQWYILLITNYSNDPCNIIFDQQNATTPGAGSTNCGIMPSPAANNGPLCCEDSLQLFADTSSYVGATYYWTGPNGFTSNQQNPIIPDACTQHAGTYSVAITANGQTSPAETTDVIIYDNPIVSMTGDDICVSETATLTPVITPTGTASYHWSTGDSSLTISVLPTTTTTYTVTGTDVHGCIDTAQATVIVHPNPTSTFSAPPVCGSVPPSNINWATLTYNGTYEPGASFLWQIGGGASTSVFPSIGPHQVWWNDVASTTLYDITLTVTNSSGCTSTTTQQIQIFPSTSVIAGCCINPETNAGPDFAVCGLTTQFNGSVNPSTVGTWTKTGGPGTAIFSNSDEHDADATVTVSQAGVYTFEWAEVSGSCDSSDYVQITFNEIPNANAGPDQIICGNQTTLAATPSVGNGQWVVPPFIAVVPSTSPTATATTVPYGTYDFIWIENNQGCNDTDIVKITYNEVPSPNAGPNQTVCGNTVNLTGTPNGSVFTGHWVGSNGTLYQPNDTSNVVTATILPVTTQIDVSFWWYQSNAICSDSDEVVITFEPFAGPGQVVAGFDTAVCDTFAVLNGTNYLSGTTTTWSTLASNVIISDPYAENPSISINPSVTDYGDSSKYTVTMTFTVSNSGGCTASDLVNVTFYELPRAYAGLDQAECVKETKLRATPSIAMGTGTWSTLTIPPPIGTTQCIPNFTSQIYPTPFNDPNVIITVPCYGVYTFVWREQNAFYNTCWTTDTVIIEFVETPNFNAGVDQYVCGDTAQLHAFDDSNADFFTWQVAPVFWLDSITMQQDPSQINNPDVWVNHIHNINDSVLFIGGNGNYSTIPLIGNYTAQCVRYDTVVVYFYVDYPATHTWNPIDSVQCGPQLCNLNASQPPQGIGQWVDNIGTTDFTPNSYALNACADVESYGNHVFYWVVKNGINPYTNQAVCIDSSDAIPIRFIQLPIANSGGQLWADNPQSGSEIKWDTICGNSYPLNPNLNGVGVLQWISPFTTGIIFATTDTSTSPVPNDTVVTLIYNSDPGNPAYYEVHLQMDNSQIAVSPFSHGCIDKDTLRITFARIPSGDIFIRPPYCYGDTALIAPEFDPLGQPNQFSWDFHGGTVEYIRPNSATSNPNDSIYLVVWDTTGTDMEHTVSLVSKNPWGCYSQSITDTIFEPTPIYPMDSIVPTTCMDCNGKIWVYPIDSLQTTYEWINPYNVRFRYQSWSPSIFCTDTLAMILPDTGKVTATFQITSDTMNLIPEFSEIFFENTSVGGKKYEWHFGDGVISSGEVVSHIYSKSGCFDVYLVAWSREDCEDRSDSITICLDEKSMCEVPNIFSPNGDMKNDYFQVNAKTLKSFKGTLINRWGKTVYEWDVWDKETYPTSGWNGKIKETEASPGVYYYIIIAEGWDDVKYELKGAFHLVKEK